MPLRPTPASPRRRVMAAAFIAAPALWLGPRAQAQPARRATPGRGGLRVRLGAQRQ